MSKSDKKLISYVIPVFNEEKNITPFYQALMGVVVKLKDEYDYEIIFTDNHSTDDTFAKLKELANEDKRVKVIRFSRNFGFQRSIITGYLNASGDAAMELDCDLQDPPALIPEFISYWRQGYQVVYGVRRSRREFWLMRLSRKIFYRLIDFLSEDKLPHDAGDFRLIDRQVIDELAKFDDYQPYIRGSIAAMGFNQTGIVYDREERRHGSGKFSLMDYINLATDGILNHSIVPLRIATFTGIFVSFVTFVGLAVYLIGKLLFRQHWPAGFATTTSLILISLSLNALFLGIIGEYLGRIYQQVKKRPLTIVERRINIGDEK